MQKINWNFKFPRIDTDIIFSAVFCVLFIFAIFLPEIITNYINQFPYYVNGWDEMNYLTHQMSLMHVLTPSYWFPSLLYLLFEKLGISGGWQNMIYDIVFIPGIFIFLSFSFKNMFSFSWSKAGVYSLIMMFCSVLFTTPMIPFLHSFSHFPDKADFFTYAVSNLPVILRSPNPQISYFIISFCLFLYSKYNRNIILLFPLPFLSFSVGFVYLYVLGVLWLRRFVKSNVILNVFITNIIMYVILSSSIWVLYNVLNFQSDLIVYTNIFHLGAYILSLGSSFHFPIVLLFFIPMTLIFTIKMKTTQSRYFEVHLSCIVACLFLSNLSLLSGVMFAPKIIQDSGIVILEGVMLINIICAINHMGFNKISKIISYIIIAYMFYHTAHSLGFSINKKYNDEFSLNIVKYPVISKDQLNTYKSKAPFVIFSDNSNMRFFSQALPYVIPSSWSSFSSVQYSYASYLLSCSNNLNYFKQTALSSDSEGRESMNLKDYSSFAWMNKPGLAKNIFMLKEVLKYKYHFSDFNYCSYFTKKEKQGVGFININTGKVDTKRINLFKSLLQLKLNFMP